MPIYLYANPNDENEVIEVIQSIFEKHEFYKDGIKYNRVFTKPTATISSTSKLNPFDSRAFAELTGNKKGTIGDLENLSAELSEKRQKMVGKDEIKERFYKNYSTKRNGVTHPSERKEKLEKLTKEVELKIKKG